MGEKLLKAKLHVLSPIHIGCDDVYEPFSFVIDEKNKSLIGFVPFIFYKKLPPADQQMFTSICEKGDISSILKLYQFMHQNKNIDLVKEIKRCEIEVSDEFIEHYKNKILINKNQNAKQDIEINRFVINRTAYNPHTDIPYIPGSSLKGSLRTGYLNKLAKDADIKNWHNLNNKSAQELESKLLKGSFSSDPFSMLKVSDFHPVKNSDFKLKIVYAINKKKKKSQFEAKGPYQILEVVKDSVFEGRININQPRGNCEIKDPIDERSLIIAMNKFYRNIFEEERKILDGVEIKSSIYEKYEKYKGKIKFGCLVRLGRHSGAEAVTIEGNRNINIMQGKGQKSKQNHSTTLWLASDSSSRVKDSKNILDPFGWAILEIFDGV